MRGATLATLALASCVGVASGACPKDCSGHGTCGKDGTTCACDPGWGAGPDEGDCALAVVPLTGGEAVAVEGLAVGAWAYFSLEVPGGADVFVVEAVDRSGAGADPRLFGARGALPTLTEYSDADWRDWFYDLGDVHYVEGYGVAGDRYFVGLYNDAARGTEAVYANVTARFGSVASPPCLLDCGAHGSCESGGAPSPVAGSSSAVRNVADARKPRRPATCSSGGAPAPSLGVGGGAPSLAAR